MIVVEMPVELDQLPPEPKWRTILDDLWQGLVRAPGEVWAVSLFLVVLVVGAAVFSPGDADQMSPPAASTAEYRLLVEVSAGAQAIRAVYYRDGSAELLPDKAAAMPDVAVVVVTVASKQDGEVGCRITVNDVVIDDARASGGGQALCVWVAGQGPVVAAEAGVLSRT